MRTAHVLAVLVCLTPLAQEDEPSFEEEVAALIERTNALESFRLVYDFETTADGEPQEGTIEVLYRAPDFSRALLTLPEGEMDFWMVGDDFHVLVPEVGWKYAHFEEPTVCAVLDEHFPSADESAGRGLTLFVDVRIKDGEANLDLQIGHGIGGRKYLLGWLGSLSTATDVAREEDAFVWSEEGVQRRISRRTGLLEELLFEAPEQHFRLHLQSAELDIELPQELLEPPREALEQPEDPEVSRLLFQTPWLSVRQMAFERADQWLTRSGKALDEPARTDWREVLDALHSPVFEATHTSMDAHVGQRLAQAAEDLREERVRDPSAEHLVTLTEKLAKSRASLEASLAATLEKQLAGLPLVDSVSREALYEIEREVFPVLWDELVAAPILARHDEELAAALER